MGRVSFLGLGTMGAGMVGKLLDAGHELTVWNRTPGRADAVVARGATLADSPAAAVAGADFVLYCLADDAAVSELVLGEGGLATSVPRSAIVIDLSTIDPETSAAERSAYEQRGVRFLDAPVFGTRGEANEGGLWVVVGGDRADFDAAAPVLEPISATRHHLGAGGNGTKMKLVGNLLVASQLEALGEALTLAKKAGLELRDVLDVLRVTDFRTPIYDGVGDAVLRSDYHADFALHLMRKDARLISALAARLEVALPSTAATLTTIERAVEAGYGDENASALIKVLAADADVALHE